MSKNFEADTVNYREEILRLVAEGGKDQTYDKIRRKGFRRNLGKKLQGLYRKAVGRNQLEDHQHAHRTALRTFNILGACRTGREKYSLLRDALHSANRFGVRWNLPRKAYFAKDREEGE